VPKLPIGATRLGQLGQKGAGMNRSGSLSTQSRSKRRVRRCNAAVCLLQFASALGDAEPKSVRLAVSEGKDIRSARLTSKDRVSFGQIRDIVRDHHGFLCSDTSDVLNRYEGYQFKPRGRDRLHGYYPSAGFFPVIVIDCSSPRCLSSNEFLDRFDPAAEVTTLFPINANSPNGVLGPVRDVRQDWAGILWLSSEDGLHRLDSATGTFRHHSRYWADPANLSSTVVRSTYEDRQRTFVAWTTRVCLAGSGRD
jgi:hypothetical protein